MTTNRKSNLGPVPRKRQIFKRQLLEVHEKARPSPLRLTESAEIPLLKLSPRAAEQSLFKGPCRDESKDDCNQEQKIKTLPPLLWVLHELQRSPCVSGDRRLLPSTT